MNSIQIPELVDIGSNWKTLPEGIHPSTLDELKNIFVYNKKREELFSGLERALALLKQAGCKNVYIDGSFVTEKEFPSDIDVCWDTNGVDRNILDPVFNDFSNGRANQKLRFGSEFFPAQIIAERLTSRIYLDFFQIDKHSGNKKGLIHIDLTKVTGSH